MCKQLATIAIVIALLHINNLVVSVDYSIENIDSSELNEANLRRAVSALSLVPSSSSSQSESSSYDPSFELLSPSTKKETVTSPMHNGGRCEPITVPMCLNLEYNMTAMPNQFEHTKQSEAAADAHQFWALVEFNCASELKFFLCSMYTPICIPGYTQPIRACRSVCMRARLGCERYMKKFGFEWPDHMRCELFPEYGTGDVCMDPMDAAGDKQQRKGSTSADTISKKPVNHPRKHSRIQSSSSPSSLSQDELIRLDLFGGGPQRDRAKCPSPFVLIDRDVTTVDLPNCAQPCKSLYFNDGELKFMSYWLFVWSMLCMLSSICTTCTYLIEPSRFKYPEKPIIYLSICYLFVSLGYLMRFVFGHDRMACELDGSLRSFESSSSSSSAAWPCLISFTLIYYFTMSSSVWWCVMSLAWFLSAGLKWCAESIGRYRAHFHFVAWSLPLAQTLTILAHSYVEADAATGICSSSSSGIYLSLLPATVYLVVGIVFLVAGFIALLKVRRSFSSRQRRCRRHHSGSSSSSSRRSSSSVANNQKLDKLMIRIGVFSILFTVPATCVIAANYYESVYRTDWEKSTFCRHMESLGDYQPSICSGQFKKQKPEFWIFVLKYFMSLIIGVTSGFWIWSSKSLHSWQLFLSKIGLISSDSGATHASKLTPNSSSECTVAEQQTSAPALCCLVLADLFGCSSRKLRRKDSVVYFQANDDPMTCANGGKQLLPPTSNLYDLPHQAYISDNFAHPPPVLITTASCNQFQLYQQQPHLMTLSAPFYEYSDKQMKTSGSGPVNSNSTHSTISTIRR